MSCLTEDAVEVDNQCPGDLQRNPARAAYVEGQMIYVTYPMTDPWCWYIYANIGGILMVNVTIYSGTMDPRLSIVVHF
jgi:hypothetical protein